MEGILFLIGGAIITLAVVSAVVAVVGGAIILILFAIHKEEGDI